MAHKQGTASNRRAELKELIRQQEQRLLDCIGVKSRPQPTEGPFGIPLDGEEKWEFAYTTARRMLKAGYHIKYVYELTGTGWIDLEDIQIDEDGYGVIEVTDGPR